MPASINDKFCKAAPNWTGQIGGAGVADGTAQTIPFASATGLPTDTATYVGVDRVDANQTATPTKKEVTKIVVSGDSGTTATRGVEGTAQAHAAGAVVEGLFVAAMWNALIDGILVEHGQDGKHTKVNGNTVTAGTDTVTLNAASQTLTNKTLTAPVINAPKTVQGVDAYTPAAGATQDIDLSLKKSIYTITMPAGALTLSVSNEEVGRCFMVEINNVTSQGALTWFSTIRWAGGAPTLTGTNGKRDTFGFRVTGTDTYDGYIVGQNI